MSLTEQYAGFEASHSLSRLTVGKERWTYIACGAGPRTVVILPGGGADAADSLFPLVAALEGRFSVIAVGYSPDATTLNGLVEGVQAILDARGIARCTLLGHSLGGFVARAYAEAHPDRTRDLIVANCADYSPARRRLVGLSAAVAGALPRALAGALFRAQFNRLLRPLSPEDRQFWGWYLDRVAASDTFAEAMRNQMRCMRDVSRQPGPRPAAGWKGRVMLIESELETGFTLGERQALRRTYPGASVHVIAGAGHLSYISHTGDFVGTVRGFLDESGD